MNEVLLAAIAASAGIGLGLIFYGGLWWTVVRSVRRGALQVWPMSSFLSRASLAVGGFYAVAQNDRYRWLTCLGGFVIARLVVTRLTRLQVARP